MVSSRHIEELVSILSSVLTENRYEYSKIVLGLLKVLRNILDSFIMLRRFHSSSKLNKAQLA